MFWLNSLLVIQQCTFGKHFVSIFVRIMFSETHLTRSNFNCFSLILCHFNLKLFFFLFRFFHPPLMNFSITCRCFQTSCWFILAEIVLIFYFLPLVNHSKWLMVVSYRNTKHDRYCIDVVIEIKLHQIAFIVKDNIFMIRFMLDSLHKWLVYM